MAPRKPISINQKKDASATLSARMESFYKRKASTGVSWRDVSADSLKCALQAALAADMAVMFSPAAGGTGVCLTLYQGGDKQKEYVMTSAELNDLLDAVAEGFSSSSEDTRASITGGAD